MTENPDIGKRAAALAAVDFINDGDLVGLGTGSTIKYLLDALAVRVKAGLQIQGIPTSEGTAKLATQFNIPLLHPEQSWNLHVAIDGADQIDPQYNLIKGGGGALVREKIVAYAAQKFIVLVDESKHVTSLGDPWALPVEVIPFGWQNTARLMKTLGGNPRLREKDGNIFISDNGNYIVDLQMGRIVNPAILESQLNNIPGVVENGLFVGRASIVITGSSSGVKIEQRAPTSPSSPSPH
jgi:ribose 5-phosphate isomerase A